MTHAEQLRAALVAALPHAVEVMAGLADHGSPAIKAASLAALARLLGRRPGRRQLRIFNNEQKGDRLCL